MKSKSEGMHVKRSKKKVPRKSGGIRTIGGREWTGRGGSRPVDVGSEHADGGARSTRRMRTKGMKTRRMRSKGMKTRGMKTRGMKTRGMQLLAAGWKRCVATCARNLSIVVDHHARRRLVRQEEGDEHVCREDAVHLYTSERRRG